MTTIDQSVDFATATGGGGHWESLGTPAQAKGQYIEGDIYRLWSLCGCFVFRKGAEQSSGGKLYYIIGSSRSGAYQFYPEGYESEQFLQLAGGVLSEDPPLFVDHWVPDA